MSQTSNPINLSEFSEIITARALNVTQSENLSAYDELNLVGNDFYFLDHNCLSTIFSQCNSLTGIKRVDENLRINTPYVPGEFIRNESELGNYVLSNSDRIPALRNYPYVIGREYYVYRNFSNKGKGDLLFTDGNGHFLVVEVKFIPNIFPNQNKTNGLRRNMMKKKYVAEQAEYYAMCLMKYVDRKKIQHVGLTNCNMGGIMPKKL